MTRKLFQYTILLLSLTACKVEPIEDPNNPGAGTIATDASLSEIQNLVDGTESAMRDALGFYYDDVGVIGREIYRFSTSDPRFTSDLLGKATAQLDSNTFYITNPYGARYRAIKNTNILIDALTNTKAEITDAQRKAGIAYAKTIQAYQLLMVYNLLYDNGLRVDVKDPDNLGPFLPREDAINAISSLLDAADADLKGNDATFPFTTALYSSKASEFSKFNRALAARVDIYKQDWAAAGTALSNSFLDLNGDLNAGAYNLFSAAGNDQLNPVYYPQNSSGETRVAQPLFVSEAEAGDKRLSKVSKRTTKEFQDGLESDYDFFLYKSNTAPIPIIRNEELILIYAEVKAQTSDPGEAVKAINIIRNAAGLKDYSGGTDKESLINEILKQRRYSLYGEGHRWIDLRRYNRLNELPIDRPNDDVWKQFPVPANE
jgi:starch-binding outer membrane protein, SusD/RagB family